MFIGAGIGLIFDRPDVGGAIGMGVGFLLMGLIKARGVEAQPITIDLPRTLSSALMVMLGVLVIAIGGVILLKPEWLYPYVVAMAAMALGAFILTAGLLSLARKPSG
ncbi:MAG: hypothetical protein DRJ97_03205 [Thermoprotei archaeon]|nr:MAG: hypothetical protein DRJ97_03205 [Thermoprotei archaeon]